MKRRVFFVLLMIFFAGSSTWLFSHGIAIEVLRESPFITVQPRYSEGQHAPGISVTVLAPGEEKPFQKGISDFAGRFVFIPDRAGEWKVIADDGRGHHSEKTILIEEGFFQPPTASKSQPAPPEAETREVPVVPLWMKILLGLSIILGLTGLFYGLKAGREAKS
jgi:hypothetical protein